MRDYNKIRAKLKAAATYDELVNAIRNAEPPQENGHPTSFVNHLRNSYWYHTEDTEATRAHALNLCDQYEADEKNRKLNP